MDMKQAGGVSPLKLFGAMLTFFRERAGLTPEQLGALVNLSGSLIRKVEAGHRTASEQLVAACEAIEDLHCDGALRELFKNMPST
jgi:transcriptional regulator with XRE-family HTH domain